MAGYRRLNGPFDALQSGLATVQQAANTVTNYTNTAQTGLQKVENTVNRVTSATQSSTSPVAPSDSGWGAVRDWARTGRAPSGLNAPNATLYAYRLWDWVPLHFVRAFEPASFQTLDDLRRSDRAHSRPATNAQIDIAHRVMRQAYDLWTRAGAYATVVIDGKPTAIFQLFQNNLNKG